MTERAVPIKRTIRPLQPRSSIVFVQGIRAQVIAPEQIEVANVGHKAFGLACVPTAWTKPFFVVDGRTASHEDALAEGLMLAGLGEAQKLLVRSSGVGEGMLARGELESGECSPTRLGEQLATLRAGVDDSGVVHWVVQEAIEQRAKGHLSNERRIAKDKRDWAAELEASTSYAGEFYKLPLRTWRDKRAPSESKLLCAHRELLVDRLRTVAAWTYERLIRVHYEWVWDGSAMYVVQADPCDEIPEGVDPHALLRKVAASNVREDQLSVFRTVNNEDFAKYRKLANVDLYRRLGYAAVPFYVLDQPDQINEFGKGRSISPAVLQDLELLTHAALIIRTDGLDIPAHLREMLPRSDELRTAAAAADWLNGTFAAKARARNEKGECLLDYKLCLIAHHFVLAVASAWCQALPDQRRVRIESLWGIPEGLYWYAYDVFDVDTTVAGQASIDRRPKSFIVRSRQRYKEHFIGPDANGAWVVHRTSEKADWARSIARTEWISEIAWTTRCIATIEGRPTVVMWLVDTAPGCTKHRVLPWYHTEWKHEGKLFKASPRKKLVGTAEVVVRNTEDWATVRQLLQAGRPIARIRVDPREPELVRNPAFVDELAAVTRQHKNVVELSGGILSHAYYMLARAGCDVECADLDDFATDDDSIQYNKLVRDEIPHVIADRGENVAVMKLEGEALVAALKRKLVEEALEVLDAKSVDQITEELADVQEVIGSLMRELEIADARVDGARKEKLRGRGGFSQGLMLGRTAMSAPLLASQCTETGASGEIAQKTLQRVAELPSNTPDDVHVDFRHDDAGAAERQLTLVVPAHAAGFTPSRVSINLPTHDKRAHEMVCEVQLDRQGADLRLRIRLINPPHQLTLDFQSEDGSGVG